MDDLKTPLSERFCQHVARYVHPVHLNELLLSARLVGPAHPEWSTFAQQLIGVSRSTHRAPPCPDELIALAIDDPTVRKRVRVFLGSAARSDPVDAVQDAEMILWLMQARLERKLRASPWPRPD